MNDKEPNLDCLPNEVLHENTHSTYKTLENEGTHTFTSTSKRPLISSSGERKPPKHIFSPSHEVTEEASDLIPKNSRETSRLSGQANNYNIDVITSTYALQIALKNMKERYQRLQKKISVLEEENGRLINGKSELFNEIGKMQESSIKLREKNLQLNHEVHSKHQECCSLKEQFATMSKENLLLTTQLSQSATETKKLNKEIEGLTEENTILKEGLEQILSHCRKFPNLPLEFSSLVERIANKNLIKHQPSDFWPKMKIIPNDDNFEILEEFQKVANLKDLDIDGSSFAFDESKDVESQSVDALLRARDTMRRMAFMLQTQNQQLTDLKFLMPRVCKQKSDSSDVEEDSGGDPCRNYLSRFATCGSARPPSVDHLSSEERIESGAIEDSGGETNVLVEEVEEEQDCRQIPFDWRKVEVSEDEDDPTGPLNRPLPATRTVSTSPDLTLTFDGLDEGRRSSRDLSSEEDRTCPMCHAVFPLLLSQETFESHVVSHFEIENGFEVIT